MCQIKWKSSTKCGRLQRDSKEARFIWEVLRLFISEWIGGALWTSLKLFLGTPAGTVVRRLQLGGTGQLGCVQQFLFWSCWDFLRTWFLRDNALSVLPYVEERTTEDVKFVRLFHMGVKCVWQLEQSDKTSSSMRIYKTSVLTDVNTICITHRWKRDGWRLCIIFHCRGPVLHPLKS